MNLLSAPASVMLYNHIVTFSPQTCQFWHRGQCLKVPVMTLYRAWHGAGIDTAP